MTLSKIHHASLVALIVATLVGAGCSPAPEQVSNAKTEIVGPEYSATKGLYVPEETRRSLGLKIVEVVAGLRVEQQAEELGLDLALHGEAAYQP